MRVVINTLLPRCRGQHGKVWSTTVKHDATSFNRRRNDKRLGKNIQKSASKITRSQREREEGLGEKNHGEQLISKRRVDEETSRGASRRGSACKNN